MHSDAHLNPVASLVADYNKVAAALGRPSVNRFSDKPTALKRLEAIINDAHVAGFTIDYFVNGSIDKLAQYGEAATKAEVLALDDARAEEEFRALTAEEAPAVEAPATEAPAATEGASGGSHTTLNLAAKIRVLHDANPKRQNTRARKLWDLYTTGMSAQEYIDRLAANGFNRRVALGALHWDENYGYIQLTHED